MLNQSSGLSRLVFPVVAALLLAVCGGTTGGTGGTGDGKYNGTIHIASSTWTGYAIIYVANAKDTWKSHGLDVKFQDVEDPNDRLLALTAGRLEGMASTVDAFARAQANGVPAVEVFPIDASVGGDGILAKSTIKTVQAGREKLQAAPMPVDGGRAAALAEPHESNDGTFFDQDR